MDYGYCLDYDQQRCNNPPKRLAERRIYSYYISCKTSFIYCNNCCSKLLVTTLKVPN